MSYGGNRHTGVVARQARVASRGHEPGRDLLDPIGVPGVRELMVGKDEMEKQTRMSRIDVEIAAEWLFQLSGVEIQIRQSASS